MRSGANVRGAGNVWFVDTHLIPDHRIANIFDKAAELIRILDVVEKAFNHPSLRQWLEFTENAFQFPNNPRLLDLTLDPGERELTSPAPSSDFSPWRHLQEPVRRVRQKGLRPWVPMTLSFVYLPSSAGARVSVMHGICERMAVPRNFPGYNRDLPRQT